MKTRLIPAIRAAGAAELAAAMLHDVWTVVSRTPGCYPILAATEIGSFGFSVSDDQIWIQECGDLGVRIESIVRRGLDVGRAAIAIGADVPLIRSEYLQEALHALEGSDAAIGPSDDGGFWLLGLRRCPKGLLAELPWSQPETCARTLGRLQENGMHVSRITRLFDVDTTAELDHLRTQLALMPAEIAPFTREWMELQRW